MYTATFVKAERLQNLRADLKFPQQVEFLFGPAVFFQINRGVTLAKESLAALLQEVEFSFSFIPIAQPPVRLSLDEEFIVGKLGAAAEEDGPLNGGDLLGIDGKAVFKDKLAEKIRPSLLAIVKLHDQHLFRNARQPLGDFEIVVFKLRRMRLLAPAREMIVNGESENHVGGRHAFATLRIGQVHHLELAVFELQKFPDAIGGFDDVGLDVDSSGKFRLMTSRADGEKPEITTNVQNAFSAEVKPFNPTDSFSAALLMFPFDERLAINGEMLVGDALLRVHIRAVGFQPVLEAF